MCLKYCNPELQTTSFSNQRMWDAPEVIFPSSSHSFIFCKHLDIRVRMCDTCPRSLSLSHCHCKLITLLLIINCSFLKQHPDRNDKRICKHNPSISCTTQVLISQHFHKGQQNTQILSIHYVDLTKNKPFSFPFNTKSFLSATP